MKRQFIALFLVIVMVVSAFTILATTTAAPVAAATPTTLTLTASTPTPAVGQKVTFTVKLYAGSTGLSKTVKIWHYKTDGQRSNDAPVTTVNGVKTFTVTFGSNGPREYHAEWVGDSSYAASHASPLTVNVGGKITPKLTITPSQTTGKVGDTITLNVGFSWWWAGQNKWMPISNKKVRIYHDTTYLDSSETLRGNDVTVTTDANGKASISVKLGTEPTKRVFYATFDGDSLFNGVTGKTAAITAKWGTTLTISVPATVLVGQQYTISGDLKDQNGKPLAGRSIQLNFKFNNQGYTLNVDVKTDANGHYSWTTKETSAKTLVWQTKFAEESMYWGAKSPERTSATKWPTTLTGRWFRDSVKGLCVDGYLKDSQGAPLGNKQIKIWVQKYGENTWTTVATGYTDSTGYYRIPIPFPGGGTWYYQAVFHGDSTYNPSGSAKLTYAV